ncbi:hypothetical protein KC19_6G056700 [Ceratodon purpureus]|uniref:Uncharacterized protein n=1 Tax=Ceratodon purpureus TaxID=3225 RepID=A0A8T0HFG2_CERPU|nr:hypothetical protein KC19_6G056700 [Ceratodon purpureus]
MILFTKRNQQLHAYVEHHPLNLGQMQDAAAFYKVKDFNAITLARDPEEASAMRAQGAILSSLSGLVEFKTILHLLK